MDAVAWSEIVAALDARSADLCVAAAARLHAEASADDIPNLLALLESSDFFVREAAAWPLAELAGPSALVSLFRAYQRGLDEGHDNDSFTAALLEIPARYGEEAEAAVVRIIDDGAEPARSHAQWLLQFCEKDSKK